MTNSISVSAFLVGLMAVAAWASEPSTSPAPAAANATKSAAGEDTTAHRATRFNPQEQM
jgi:hypothetical protein